MASRWSVRRSVAAAVVAVAMWKGGAVGAQTIERVDDQIALSVELLQVSVDEWQARSAVSVGSADDQARAAALSDIEKRFKATRARVFERHRTNAADYLVFFAKHADDVAAYLEEHPEIKARIEALNQTLRGLIGGGESKGAAPGARP